MAGKRSNRNNSNKPNGGAKQNGVTNRTQLSYGSVAVQYANQRSRPDAGIRIERGRDFLTRVPIRFNPTTVASRILAQGDLAPTSYPGTRMTQMGELFEMYRWRKLNLEYVPGLSSTIGCQLLLYIDNDPNDDPSTITDIDALVRQATAQAGSKQWSAFSRAYIPLIIRKDGQFYYTNTDANKRFSVQGRWHLIQVTTPTGVSGAALTADIPEPAAIYLDWEVEFQIPQINPAAAVSALLAPVVPQALTIGDLNPSGTKLLAVQGLQPGQVVHVAYESAAWGTGGHSLAFSDPNATLTNNWNFNNSSSGTDVVAITTNGAWTVSAAGSNPTQMTNIVCSLFSGAKGVTVTVV